MRERTGSEGRCRGVSCHAAEDIQFPRSRTTDATTIREALEMYMKLTYFQQNFIYIINNFLIGGNASYALIA